MHPLKWLCILALSPLITWGLIYAICFALMCIGFAYGKTRRWYRKRTARHTAQSITR